MKRIEMEDNMINKTKWLVVFPLLLAAGPLFFLLPESTRAGQGEEAAKEFAIARLSIPAPQPFCGYCHILTYPNIVQKGYELWKKGKHNNVGCVECHYPPKKKKAYRGHVSGSKDEIKHIPKKPPERFSYIELGGGVIRTRPRIVDASCLTSNCHGNPKDEFRTKKIKFTGKVAFVHEPHLDKAKQIEGQQVNCASCHQHETENKHFEVSKGSCFLCHFTKAKFNQERARCDLCHKLPEKPIQTSGEKPITHRMLKDAGVSCSSCHFELIQAAGGGHSQAYFEKGQLRTAVVLGAGRIKQGNCESCHDRAKDLKEKKNGKLLHQKHVTVKNTRCVECHEPVRHQKAKLLLTLPKSGPKMTIKEVIKDQTVQAACGTCHPDPHRYQRLLAAGLKRRGVIEAPDPMRRARTNCLGCHIELGTTAKGERTLVGSARACVRCHTKDHEKMLREWKAELSRELEFAKEVKEEALTALEEAKSKLSKAKMHEAMGMLREGRENLDIVRFGNGVHNKKYSMFLIDAAITSFEDVLDYIEEETQN
ncbi:MAG: hypothetical protein JRJ03_15190 [Deltaproteobacteria bacterium]|nr:hypothetical protein [Deltaproteobacteria bacterium]